LKAGSIKKYCSHYLLLQQNQNDFYNLWQQRCL
jgi:hypothetical protein